MNVGDASLLNLQSFGDSQLESFLSAVALFAKERGERVGIVGGPVRDLLLGKPLQEIDLLVEGDALSFVGAFVENAPRLLPQFPLARLSRGFEKFGTIKMFYPEECGKLLRVVDFASAREEKYPTPGRSPVAQYPLSFEVDLKRRDFSVNSLLLICGEGSEFQLLDPFGGREDLQRKELRTLHRESFLDDPARLLRGLRFQVRFDFRWEEKTEKAVQEACLEGYLFTLTAQRRFDEFRKALREQRAFLVLQKFSEWGILGQIHPEMVLEEPKLLEAEKEQESLLREAKLLACLFTRIPLSEYETLLKEWGLSRKLAGDFVKVRSDVA